METSGNRWSPRCIWCPDVKDELTVLVFVSQLFRAIMKSPCGTWRPETGDWRSGPAVRHHCLNYRFVTSVYRTPILSIFRYFSQHALMNFIVILFVFLITWTITCPLYLFSNSFSLLGLLHWMLWSHTGGPVDTDQAKPIYWRMQRVPWLRVYLYMVV